MILVAGNVDGRYLALAEGVVKRVVDLADGNPQLGCRVAVDDKIGLQSLVLLVAVDVRKARVALQGRRDLRRPFIEILEGGPLQGKLILRIARASADADILHRLQKQRCSRN